MVVETWLSPQNDRKTWFSGSMQASYTHATIGSAPKNTYFWYLGTLYGKTLTFSISKKPFNVWNQSTPQNNTTVYLPDSVLQHWKPLKLTIVVKKWYLLFFSLIDGRPGYGINIVANTELFLSIGSVSYFAVGILVEIVQLSVEVEVKELVVIDC